MSFVNNFYIRVLVECVFYTFVLLKSIHSHATNTRSDNEPVNILTWWGYLTHKDLLDEVEKNCQVKISFDEYYSNFEFIRRKSNRYDILIYSGTVRGFIENDDKLKSNADISLIAKDYHKVFKRHYLEEGYPRNTLYFMFAETVFLWDADKISLYHSDSIEEMFRKAGEKKAVIIDNYIEVLTLLLNESKHDFFSEFKRILGDASLIISNNLGEVVEDDDFAIGYLWSGEAIAKMSSSRKNLKMMVHPSLSHITKDLITVLSEDEKSLCVAKELASESFLSKLAAKEFYFSPFHKKLNIENQYYDKMYKEFDLRINNLRWLKKFTIEEHIELEKKWQRVKIELGYNT